MRKRIEPADHLNKYASAIHTDEMVYTLKFGSLSAAPEFG